MLGNFKENVKMEYLLFPRFGRKGYLTQSTKSLYMFIVQFVVTLTYLEKERLLSCGSHLVFYKEKQQDLEAFYFLLYHLGSLFVYIVIAPLRT